MAKVSQKEIDLQELANFLLAELYSKSECEEEKTDMLVLAYKLDSPYLEQMMSETDFELKL